MRDGEELTILDTSAWRSMNRGRTTFLLRNNCMLEFFLFFRINSFDLTRPNRRVLAAPRLLCTRVKYMC